MTRFSYFTDNELDMMEEAFCNEGLKSLVFEIRKERSSRMFFEPQESDYKGMSDELVDHYSKLAEHYEGKIKCGK